MSGSLVLLQTETVTSATASVSLGDSYWDTSFDVYMVTVNNCIPVTNGVDGQVRVLKSGTVQSDSNYDFAFLGQRSDTTFGNLSSTGSPKWTYPVGWSTRNTATEAGVSGNAVMYLFNFNESDKHSFITVETVTQWTGGTLGAQGGGVHKVKSLSDGINFQFHAGNIDTGAVFKLYGLKK